MGRQSRRVAKDRPLPMSSPPHLTPSPASPQEPPRPPIPPRLKALPRLASRLNVPSAAETGRRTDGQTDGRTGRPADIPTSRAGRPTNGETRSQRHTASHVFATSPHSPRPPRLKNHLAPSVTSSQEPPIPPHLKASLASRHLTSPTLPRLARLTSPDPTSPQPPTPTYRENPLTSPSTSPQNLSTYPPAPPSPPAPAQQWHQTSPARCAYN